MCAYDTKRFLLDDGINSLAYGHKDIRGDVDEVEINNPGSDQILSYIEARRMGLLCSRRRGAINHIGFHPSEIREESENNAIAAGCDKRSRLRDLMSIVPDEPDRLIPQEDRPILHRRAETNTDVAMHMVFGDDNAPSSSSSASEPTGANAFAHHIDDAFESALTESHAPVD